MANLTRLTLTNFRNYDRLVLEPQSQKLIVYGPNASGKTNLLEALSLLVPGRGFRKARVEDIIKQDHLHQGWGIVGEFSNSENSFTVATGGAPFSSKKQYRINGKNLSNQYEITQYLTAIWLTPQMDRLFLEGASGRRRFLDQLITSTESYYTKELLAYEKSVVQRNKLLSFSKLDNAWLNAVEESMARHAVAITVARMNFIQQLNQISIMQDCFPEVLLKLECPIVDFLYQQPALVAEDYLKQQWKEGRFIDAQNKSTALGCHRTDVVFVENKSNTPAYLASTGQQKAILISVILKLAELIKQQKKMQPLLLLDEPLTHLDAFHREILLSTLLNLNGLVMITGNDFSLFTSCQGKGEFLHINQGKIV